MTNSRNWLSVCLGAGVAVEIVIALVVRWPLALRTLEGDAAGVNLVALVGLLWLPVLGMILWAAVRRVRSLDSGLNDRDGRLNDLASMSYDWLWQAGTDLRLVGSSPASSALLGHRPEDLVGRSMLDLVHVDDAASLRAMVTDATAHDRGWTDVEVRWVHATGSVITLQGRARPILDASGRATGFRGAWRPTPAESADQLRLSGVAHRTRDLIATGSLSIAVQPIIDLDTGTWVGVEALSRFPDNGNPDRWFSDAHEAGIGVTLELHALAAALDVLPDLPPEVYLSLNASPAVILDAGFQNLMRRPDLPLSRIVVEITEHTAVSHYDDIRDVLRPHREHGLRLAVDDAGAGYASFSHVLKLRPDIIKLDRSLVTGIDLDGARRAFVTAIVVLAMELQADVTAEGVETVSELDVLRCLGVDTVQGYLLARPSPDRGRLQAWGSRDWLTHAGLPRFTRPDEAPAAQVPVPGEVRAW